MELGGWWGMRCGMRKGGSAKEGLSFVNQVLKPPYHPNALRLLKKATFFTSESINLARKRKL